MGRRSRPQFAVYSCRRLHSRVARHRGRPPDGEGLARLRRPSGAGRARVRRQTPRRRRSPRGVFRRSGDARSASRSTARGPALLPTPRPRWRLTACAGRTREAGQPFAVGCISSP